MGVTIKKSGDVTEQVLADGKDTFETTDSKGRVLTLKAPGLLDEFRAVEAVGEASGNGTWMGMYMPLLYVESIDGERVLPARTKGEADMLIQRVGREGYLAVIAALKDKFAVSEADLNFAKN